MQAERNNKPKAEFSPKKGQHSLSDFDPPVSKALLKELIALSISTAEELISVETNHSGVLRGLLKKHEPDLTNIIARSKKIANRLPKEKKDEPFPLNGARGWGKTAIPESLRKLI